jgi:hypothetical protein
LDKKRKYVRRDIGVPSSTSEYFRVYMYRKRHGWAAK